MNVAQALPAAHEWVYQKWRADQKGNVIPRWAGPDRQIEPRDAFIAEAKIVSFWPYRAGALAVADDLEMTLTEVAAVYFRALAVWAGQEPLLAACAPTGPPLCVREDAAVLARRAARDGAEGQDAKARDAKGQDAASHHGPEDAGAGARLADLGGAVVHSVLDDASITPLGAFNAIRDEARGLLTVRPAPAAVRVSQAVAELADQLLHPLETGPAVIAHEASQLQASLTALTALLAASPAAPAAGTAGTAGTAGESDDEADQ
jgi:hypothetical protein